MTSCCNPTNFDFTNYIPSIIDAYYKEIPVTIIIPATNEPLVISFVSTRNNYKNINNVYDAINFARKICILYLAKIRYVIIPQIKCSIPCTSVKSEKLIKEFSNTETILVNNINQNLGS
jgi:hypothetical protein